MSELSKLSKLSVPVLTALMLLMIAVSALGQQQSQQCAQHIPVARVTSGYISHGSTCYAGNNQAGPGSTIYGGDRVFCTWVCDPGEPSTCNPSILVIDAIRGNGHIVIQSGPNPQNNGWVAPCDPNNGLGEQ